MKKYNAIVMRDNSALEFSSSDGEFNKYLSKVFNDQARFIFLFNFVI